MNTVKLSKLKLIEESVDGLVKCSMSEMRCYRLLCEKSEEVLSSDRKIVPVISC